jgi:predicted transcriptional regulator with HTH domain
MAADTIIPDRGEFVDALQRLSRGCVMVKVSDFSGGCVLDGAPVYTAHRALLQYGLLSEFDNPQGFANVKYYRLNEHGRAFAERACAQWRRRPLLERLATRLVG